MICSDKLCNHDWIRTQYVGGFAIGIPKWEDIYYLVQLTPWPISDTLNIKVPQKCNVGALVFGHSQHVYKLWCTVEHLKYFNHSGDKSKDLLMRSWEGRIIAQKNCFRDVMQLVQ